MTLDEIVEGEGAGGRTRGRLQGLGEKGGMERNTKTPGQAPRCCSYFILPCFEKSIVGRLLFLLIVIIGPLSQIKITENIVIDPLERCDRASK